jgi:hypothetical protein
MKKFRCAESLCKQRREADEASTRPGVFLLATTVSLQALDLSRRHRVPEWFGFELNEK